MSNKPYTEEMWEQARKEATKEYLKVNENTHDFWIFKIVLLVIFSLAFCLFLYFLPNILHHAEGKDPASNEANEERVRTVTENFLISNPLKEETVFYLADFYNGKYGFFLESLIYNGKHPYECLGYVIVKPSNNQYDIDTSHYCDQFE